MTHRTEQCCKECSGWEPALHECSCQCHYSPNDESVVDWEKEFDELVMKHWHRGAGEFISPSMFIADVKDFTRSLLLKARTAEQERVVGIVTRMKKSELPDEYCDEGGEYKQGYNQALTDITKAIRNKELTD